MNASGPCFTQPVARARRDLRRLAGWIAVALLAASLVLQAMLADRARLAADPAWRPRVAALCGIFHCILPAWHEPSAFHVTARELLPHPSAPGVLRVNATIRNDAAYAQAWPVLQLTLANLDGEPLGRRRFGPRDYLGGAPASALIEPGQSASISLDVVDPGKRAVSFEFEFF